MNLAGRHVVPAHGLLWLIDPEHEIGQNVEQEIARGCWEPAVTAVVERHIRPGDVFVDVGTHVGWYSVVAASRGAVVFGVERDRDAARCCRANLAINGCTGAIDTATAGVDWSVDSGQLTRCDWIKVDTDGFELMVLQGARETLAKFRPTVLFEVSAHCLAHVHGGDGPTLVRALFAELRLHGYRFFWEHMLQEVDAEFCLAKNECMNVFAAPGLEALA